METPVEIRYAGVVVARSNEIRRMTVGGVDLFLSMPEPLPAGTVVSLNNDTQARVEKVIESSDPSVAGIYVKLLEDANQPWVPCFREDEVPAPRPPAVVVSPVIVRPVHRTFTPPEVASRPDPVRVEAPAPRPAPVVVHREETPLPEVVAMVAEPRPTVETIADPPKAFVAPLPRANEKIAHFDSPEPPPAVVEGSVKRERSKRSTIVVAIPPPAEVRGDERAEGAVKKAVGEIDTGSRRVKDAQAQVQSASIVVEPDPSAEPEAASPADEPAAETPKQAELRLEELSTARPLPSARGRATKRRKTTLR
jgi:hypothetical protein